MGKINISFLLVVIIQKEIMGGGVVVLMQIIYSRHPGIGGMPSVGGVILREDNPYLRGNRRKPRKTSTS